ncbi:MAG: GerMN domain-containing protein, partial [Lachnospiraceae bacterium]|nr:GerMN domain-containing protein [Lachnospiraceae bacterium]
MKRVKLAGLLLLLIACLCACNAATTGQTPTQETLAERSMKIYYVNKNTTKVVSEEYTPTNTEQQALLNELIAALQTDPVNMDYKKPTPSEVKVLNAHIDNKQAYVSFDNVYTTIPSLTETLNRAAIVRT